MGYFKKNQKHSSLYEVYFIIFYEKSIKKNECSKRYGCNLKITANVPKKFLIWIQQVCLKFTFDSWTITGCQFQIDQIEEYINNDRSGFSVLYLGIHTCSGSNNNWFSAEIKKQQSLLSKRFYRKKKLIKEVADGCQILQKMSGANPSKQCTAGCPRVLQKNNL